MVSTFSLFITLLAITNPIGNAAILASLTLGVRRDDIVHIAIKTGIATFITLLVSSFLGEPILSAIGVSMQAFRFAGGLILLKVGFSMFSGSHDRSNYNASEHDSEINNLAITPLTIPLIAGPGAMVTVIHFVHNISWSIGSIFTFVCAMAAVAFIVTGCLYAISMDVFSKLLANKSLVGVITRLCGLLIIAIASAMLLDSLRFYIAPASVIMDKIG